MQFFNQSKWRSEGAERHNDNKKMYQIQISHRLLESVNCTEGKLIS